jgi:hypothetical protein
VAKRKPSPRTARALGLYERLMRIYAKPKPMSDLDVVKIRAINRRIVSFLDSCDDREYDDYYVGVQARRSSHETP